MPQYTTPQCPEHLFKVANSRRDRGTFQAMKQLVNLINQGLLDAERFNGFTSKGFVEIVENDLMASDEDKLTEAVKILSKLAISRQKVQELHEQALEAWNHVNVLFSDDEIPFDSFEDIQKNLKTIKEFGQFNLRYKEARLRSREARLKVEHALDLTEQKENS